MKKLKITYIINRATQVGGIERVVSMLSSYFAEQYGYDMTVVSLETEETDDKGFDYGNKVKIEHLGYSTDEYANRRLLNQRVRKILENEEKKKTDIIITCHGNIADLVALNKRLFSGKVIFTEHASWEYYTKARKIAQILCYRRAECLVVLSESAAKIYRRYGLKNVRVIPNAIREIPKFKDSGHEKHELLAIGRLEEVKGFDNLICAVDTIKNRLDDWRIVIYGTGSKEEELKAQIKSFGLEDSVKMAGTTNEVLKKLHKASGYLLSSRNEAFPMVVMESLSCGTPVIAYSLPVIEEMNKKYKVIISVEPRDDYRAFGEAILRFIGDEKLRKNLSEQSLGLANDYLLPKIAEKWKALFEELLEVGQ